MTEALVHVPTDAELEVLVAAGMSIDTEATAPQSPPFAGLVITDRFGISTFVDQKTNEPKRVVRWTFAVRPVDYAIGGQTGAWHTYANKSDVKGAPMMEMLTSLRTFLPRTTPVGQTRMIGIGHYENEVGLFVRRNYTFKRKGQEPFVVENVLICVGPATLEQVARARTLPPHVPQVSASGSAVASGERVEAATSLAPVQLSDEQAVQLLTLYEGKTPGQIMGLATNPQLDQQLRQSILDQRALNYLTQAGLLTFDGERYQKV